MVQAGAELGGPTLSRTLSRAVFPLLWLILGVQRQGFEREELIAVVHAGAVGADQVDGGRLGGGDVEGDRGGAGGVGGVAHLQGERALAHLRLKVAGDDAGGVGGEVFTAFNRAAVDEPGAEQIFGGVVEVRGGAAQLRADALGQALARRGAGDGDPRLIVDGFHALVEAPTGDGQQGGREEEEARRHRILRSGGSLQESGGSLQPATEYIPHTEGFWAGARLDTGGL